jgi:MerR family transcriptional regulator, light-induced transcriptional regulator
MVNDHLTKLRHILIDADKIPTFNLKAVVQETGIKPDTLRAWERRYGLPQPDRTAGRHRLYSQHDINMLKWLQARQDEGLTISRAVELWRQLEIDGDSPLDVYQDEEPEPPPPLFVGETLTQMREEWIEACLQFDEQRARYILAQAFAQFPMEAVCFELLQRSLAKIGAGWYEGTVSVQQEHFASALAIRQLEALVNATPPPHKNGRLVVACAPDEQHTFSPLMITLMLRHRGWDVIYLGADVPTEQLETTLATIRPALLIVTAHTLHTAGRLPAIADLAHHSNTAMAYGGGVFAYIEDITERIPAHFLGNDLHAAPQVVENLLASSGPMPKANRPSPAYREALAHFAEQRTAVEADVLGKLNLDYLPVRHLKNANNDLGNNIQAALSLGDMNVLDANLEWVHGLLANYHYRMPEAAMQPYLTAYREAVNRHLDDRGQPILDWFAKME